jgi:hypothetical protein
MKITRRLAVHGSFSPAAVNLLRRVPQSALYYTSQQLRNPVSIYRLSLEKVGQAFCKVADGYLSKTEEYSRNGFPKSWEIDQLLKDQGDFLRIMQEHLDELWLVLKTLIDPSDATKSQLFTDKYVINSKLPGAKTFQEAIDYYKKSLRIANKLRHQQGYLRGVAVLLPTSTVLGYYLEEPDVDGSIGPSIEIHPDRGAISFARDLMWHLLNVYVCSEKLCEAVAKALNAKGISLESEIVSGEKCWEEVISAAKKIPSECFPREARRHVVGFHCDEQTLTIEFPKQVNFKFPAQIRTSCSVRLDAPTYKLPFP